MEENKTETRLDRQKRIEANSKRIQIRAVLENLHKVPMISPEMREKIQSGLRDFLPIIKDEIKAGIASMSERMGTGKERKIYVMRNGAEGLEVWTMNNMRAFDGDKVSVFSFKKIIDRIDKYQKAESLIADALTGRLFSDEDYAIDEINTEDETKKELEKKLEIPLGGQKQLEAPQE